MVRISLISGVQANANPWLNCISRCVFGLSRTTHMHHNKSNKLMFSLCADHSVAHQPCTETEAGKGRNELEWNLPFVNSGWLTSPL